MSKEETFQDRSLNCPFGKQTSDGGSTELRGAALGGHLKPGALDFRRRRPLDAKPCRQQLTAGEFAGSLAGATGASNDLGVTISKQRRSFSISRPTELLVDRS
jgi:hypothetical protein